MTSRCPGCGHNFYRDSPLWDGRCKYCHDDDASEANHRATATPVTFDGSPKCPECGSTNYVEAIKSESCSDCGYEQSYW